MSGIFSFSFSGIAVSVVQDLFQIEALTSDIEILAVYLSQSSDVGDAEAEGLRIHVNRFVDVVTNDLPEVKGAKNGGPLLADLAVNETSQLITTGIEIWHAEVWQIHGGSFIYLPPPELILTVPVGGGCTISLEDAPADPITMSGTCYLRQK